MNTIARGIVKLRFVILVVAIALLIPSAIGYLNTRVNYDILSYLPGEIETMKGQDILEEQFGTGAYSLFIVEGMDAKDTSKLKSKIEEVQHVKKVLWYDSVLDLSIPMDMLPQKAYEAFNSDNATMMFVIFDETTSSDGTMDAIRNIRKVANKQCFLAGMSAIVTDTKDLAERETPVYVMIAVILAVIVLSLTMDSYLIPLFFLLSIGMAIVYNLGSNIMFGEISFITKSLTAVLQLGVTLDYSIFLWHSFEEEKAKTDTKNEAMAHAIMATFSSVIGSSITTVAGFIALCFMSFRIGLDLGLVMAKGVLFGVVSCITILPSMILVFDSLLEKTRHKPLLPEFDRIPKWIAKHYIIFAAIFVCTLPVAIYGNNNTAVYYDLAETLPKTLPSTQANIELDKNFSMKNTYMLLVDANMTSKDINSMSDEIKKVKGVDAVLSLDSIVGSTIPDSFIPDKVKSELQSEDYKLVIVTSKYKTASDEINEQISKVNKIVKSYDKKSMVVGEAPCTKDLITITNHDFNVVNWVSIGCVFAIIFFVLKSLSLPLILVAVIEFAIFINMGIPYFMNQTLPFIASVVIGTIQLGSTVDYAILMTTRFCKERASGHTKKEATQIALSTSMKSVIVSALSFFSATFGVGLISSIDMIGALCMLMARGAIISMFVVLLVLPAMYMIFDPIIIRSSLGFAGAIKADSERKTDNKKSHSLFHGHHVA
ncbi:efflux RND transporter permease subunit [Butyrivibrio sp. NC3005]|uniref:efflux RND transporter permease subunit n=1 Tax=Butyrivibrio sp. NC3005 TaxID=1280685 RepID=UPI0004144F45|nr:MMPL family transporter [Butyrivibrio sp. NC3005]